MTLAEYFVNSAMGNRTIHLQGSKGNWYQDHMLDLFAAYKDEQIDETRTLESDTDVYIELKRRDA